jgi:lipid II:glycine glycyltransferase (peptidoglycan interpeptide bridge formation enzyme)
MIPVRPDDIAWDAFVAAHPAGHVLQTSRWAALKTEFGWTSARAALAAGPQPDAPLAAGASLLFRRLPWGQTLAYAAKGPLADWQDPAQATALLAALRRVCRQRHAALLKIEPELFASPALSGRLASYGLRPSPQRVQPVSTVHVDLTRDDDALLAAMKPKWRYNIRLAERKGVTVRQGTAADLPAIQGLMDATGRRDGFSVHSLAYHTRATVLFAPAGLLAWLLAGHEGRLLAAIAVFALGRRAWYMWGASADEGRQLMPNHALQWAAMRWARGRGCVLYDLWGIPDEIAPGAEGADADGEPPPATGAGGLWGVYRFKRGFGGQVVRYTGAWDLPVSLPGYWLYRLGLRAAAWRRTQGQITPA